MRSSKTISINSAGEAEASSLTGNIKVTREDWLNVALDVLVSEGVGEVKILAIGQRLNVSRSSFYWYFKSRQDLLDALLNHWQATNTAALVGQAEKPAKTITGAMCEVFRCFVNEALFDNDLDFAVRDWARRSGKVRKILDQSDLIRLQALTQMYERYGYENQEATARARILYFMQIGYNVAELNESLADRLKLLPDYLEAFSGVPPMQEEIDEFAIYAKQHTKGDQT